MSEEANLKETEVYKDQHTPWVPNHLIGEDEFDTVSADILCYMTVNLRDLDFTEKAAETNELMVSSLLTNGSLESIMDEIKREEEKNGKYN